MRIEIRLVQLVLIQLVCERKEEFFFWKSLRTGFSIQHDLFSHSGQRMKKMQDVVWPEKERIFFPSILQRREKEWSKERYLKLPQNWKKILKAILTLRKKLSKLALPIFKWIFLQNFERKSIVQEVGSIFFFFFNIF